MYIERLFAPHWGWIGALFLCPKPWANTKEMSKTVGKSGPQTDKWESKEFRGISRAQKP